MRAKVPQHLELEDVVAWGLGAADLVCVAFGVTAAWWSASSFDVAPAVRVLLAAPPLIVGAALGLVRIEGRSLRDWVALVLHFFARPRFLLVEQRRCG